MVDDFMVYVDRLITSACFVSADERESLLGSSGNTVGGDTDDDRSSIQDPITAISGSTLGNFNGLATGKKTITKCSSDCGGGGGGGEEGCSSENTLKECRICQEEDEERDMETPCACSGTLKFAHRKCIQKWCNKKGDITCEICNQVFSPNYTLPLTRKNPDVMAIDISQAWSPHVGLRDPHFLAFTAGEREFIQSGYNDYDIANNGNFDCFRSVVIILMLLLLLHQILMVTRDFGILEGSSKFFSVSLLQLAGFLLPCFVMARTCYIIHCRRRRQFLQG